MDTNENGLTFDDWIRDVDQELIRICGLGSRDLADFPSWDLWHDGVPPVEAAGVCLVEWNDYPTDLLEGAE
jgi:hypothetical protein